MEDEIPELVSSSLDSPRVVATRNYIEETLTQMEILRKEIKSNTHVGFWGVCSGGVVQIYPTEEEARKAGEETGFIFFQKLLIEKGTPFALAQVGVDQTMEEFASP